MWVVHSILLFFIQQGPWVIVHVSLRGLGLAKALLRTIEDEARAVGAPVLRLETGIHQQDAIRLYESAGFRPFGPFGPYAMMPVNKIETSLFFEKRL